MKTQTHYTNSKKHTLLFVLGILVLFFCTEKVLAQNAELQISGVVQSIEGPVPNATVVLKGTVVGVMADENGAFTFPKGLNENDVLVVGSLGYDDLEVTVSSNKPYIEPFLEENPIVIIAALRSAPKDSKATASTNKI